MELIDCLWPCSTARHPRAAPRFDTATPSRQGDIILSTILYYPALSCIMLSVWLFSLYDSTG